MNKNEKDVLWGKINKAIDTIRPYLQADGGDVTLVEVTDDLTVKVKLTGACEGCPFSIQTLKAGIEQAIKKEFPDLKELIAVSDI
jgi:Fe-S cluster biogenesis protein NfuA